MGLILTARALGLGFRLCTSIGTALATLGRTSALFFDEFNLGFGHFNLLCMSIFDAKSSSLVHLTLIERRQSPV